MKKNVIVVCLLLLGALMLSSGCITYRNFPTDYVGKYPVKAHGAMTYTIEGYTLFGGADRVKEIFRRESPFESTEKVIEKPAKGVHVQVKILPINPTMAAFVFGYLSVSTLTILPAWSLSDGNEIYYEIYRDGTKVKTYSYEVKRKAFSWIVMLPFAWVNFITYSESDAFEATAYNFFADAKDYLK
jgi:hypothetical protein